MKQWFKDLSKPKKALLIIGCILLALMILLVSYVVSKFSKLDTQDIDEDDIYVSENQNNNTNKDENNKDDEDKDIGVDLGTGYTNFVLFGGDSRKGEVEGAVNTDAIIVISLNNETKKVKLISVYRDTLVDNTTGYITKVNSAYSSGGPARAMSTLNKNFDLDITKYITVDFGVVADVIDQLGGIYVNISEAEMNAMNKYIKQTAKVAGKEPVYITKTGYQHVDGVQATTYARIRKGVGDDYQRTERQREVIEKVLLQVIHSNWTTIDGIIDDALPRISTNFSFGEILKYAMNFASYDIVESEGFPFDKSSASITGIKAADLIVKTADVELIQAQTVCPGKFIILFSGDLSAVRVSVDAAKVQYPEQLIDDFVLGNPHDSIFKALTCTAEIDDVKALGVIETFTGASAIVAADHAAKTAQVDVFEIRVARGMCGKSYVLLTGSVAAVEAAVEETVELLKDEGTMLDYAVIPSPSKEFVKTLM